MNNLHRKLAPISDAAWAQIDEEASRTLKRHLAGRRVVDVPEARGIGFSAVGTGHVQQVQAPGDGIAAQLREVKALVELRIPFQLSRQQIDDVERGAADADWTPVKDAARRIAFAEDRAIFDGFAAAGIEGIRQASSNSGLILPTNAKAYPNAIAQAVSELRLTGCNGPYALVLGAEAYTIASGGSDEGYPIFHHIERVVDGGIVWAPAIEGAYVLTTRGGDFELDIGQDLSIGYLSHTSTTVELYFQETFTFRVLTTEASVVLKRADVVETKKP
ncbi:family 1 encapsulin nanocompartment shell protein [Bradyrhizobium ganzhouense]|uniref:family 1 encapsulin nanocompartment shell protein n=1 Tax=Bradyrhizobium ganzhouense TaxID=1179767 RepID=UPI003CEB5DEB